jgi:hypothetical protein
MLVCPAEEGMTAIKLLLEIIEENHNDCVNKLAKGVLGEIGEVPIELTSSEEEYLRSYFQLYKTRTVIYPSWGPQGLFYHLDGVMTLSGYICRRR